MKKTHCLYSNVNALNECELANLHLDFSHDCMRINDLYGYPHYDWVDHIGRIDLKSNAKKVTCPRVI